MDINEFTRRLEKRVALFEKKAEVREKVQARKREGAKREAGQKLRDLREAREAAHAARPRWRAEACVLVATRVTCEGCGSEATTASSQAFVRHRSLRDSSLTWTHERPASLLPPDIPRELQLRHRTSDFCPSCWSAGATTTRLRANSGNGHALVAIGALRAQRRALRSEVA